MDPASPKVTSTIEMDESQTLPRPIRIDLEAIAEERGIKHFIVSSASLAIDQRLLMVPKSAIRRAQAHGVNFHGYFDFNTDGSEAECYFVPDPSCMIQLPWNPELAWVPSFVYLGGCPLALCPRRCLIRQIKRAKDLGYVMKTGIEPEFVLMKKGSTELLDEADMAIYSSLATMKTSPFILKLCDYMDKLGWGPYKAEHEAAKCQYELSFHYADALTTADRWLFIKFMVQNVADLDGMRATFMPFLCDTDHIGNGMHIHHSLWSVADDKELIPQADGKFGLSEIGQQFLAGELKHLGKNTALFLSTVNSYKRFRFPNFMSHVAYGLDSRWTCLRIVTDKGRSNRYELRITDASANPYIAHAAILASGLDGILHKYDLEDKLEAKGELLYKPPLEDEGYEPIGKTLGETLELLRSNEFAHKALGDDLIKRYIKIKEKQWKEYSQTVSAWEKSFIDCY